MKENIKDNTKTMEPLPIEALQVAIDKLQEIGDNGGRIEQTGEWMLADLFPELVK